MSDLPPSTIPPDEEPGTDLDDQVGALFNLTYISCHTSVYNL